MNAGTAHPGGLPEPCAGVIVAAGASRRMGSDKVMMPLAGQPLLVRSVRAFDACDAVASLIVVVAPERIDEISGELREIRKLAAVVGGGATRSASVREGVRAAADRGAAWAAVHDGARPLVTPEAIARVVAAARDQGAATLAEPVTDTLQRVDPYGRVEGAVDRADLWRIQTPQVFLVDELLAALDEALAAGLDATDETTLMLRAGRAAAVVENTGWNPKITYPKDIDLAEAWIARSRRSLSDL